MSARGRARRGVLAALGATTALVLAGCVQLPQDGPVVETRRSSSNAVDQPFAIDPRGPAPGAGAVDIVRGFVDAMTAWPLDTSVAREFLDEDAAASWEPLSSTVVYADALPPEDRGTQVEIRLSGAQEIDDRGAWQGELPDRRQTLRFQIVSEDGELRISDPPDSLVVPATWFAARFRQVSLYYFDPSGSILVPEPVFVPVGEQLTSTLVARLFEGPAPGGGPTRSYVPRGLTAGLSVTVSDDGVANLELVGDVPSSTETLRRMLAQLGWTLRQEPDIRALRVSVDGEVLPLPEGGQVYPVDEDQEFAPTGTGADSRLFGLREGLVVRGGASSLEATTGPLGREEFGVSTLGVSIDGDQVAAVGGTRSSLLLAPVEEPSESDDEEVPDVEQVVSGASALLTPAWDWFGRLWVVDRTEAGAVVRVRQDDRFREIEVPGVSGRPVRSFVVSRDGTRFVAVVRRGGTDEVRVGRTVLGDQNQVRGVGRTTRVAPEPFDRVRIDDVAWSSPTTLLVLTRTSGSDLAEVATVAVDGAPLPVESLSVTPSIPVVRLAGTPVQAARSYALGATGLVDLDTGGIVPFAEEPIDVVDYVG